MPGEANLGDLIVEVKLDDAQYRAQVKETLQGTVAQSKTASRQVQQSLSAGFNTAQTVQGLRALQGSLYLVTGQTGFLAIEAGRTAVALSKMATASGGVGAAMLAAGGAGIAFLKGLNPIVLALAGLSAAYLALRSATSKNTEENKEFLDSLKAIRRETDELGASEQSLREMRLRDAAKKLPFGGAMPGGQPNPALRELEQADITLSTKRAAIAASTVRKTASKEREELRRSLAVDFGVAKPSSFQNDPTMRLLMKFKERADAIREAAQGEFSRSFGIGTIASSGFRFGGGRGSVVGEQSEERKNGERLDEINATLKSEFEKLLQRISGNPVLTGFGVPYSGLPGL